MQTDNSGNSTYAQQQPPQQRRGQQYQQQSKRHETELGSFKCAALKQVACNGKVKMPLRGQLCSEVICEHSLLVWCACCSHMGRLHTLSSGSSSTSPTAALPDSTVPVKTVPWPRIAKQWSMAKLKEPAAEGGCVGAHLMISCMSSGMPCACTGASRVPASGAGCESDELYQLQKDCPSFSSFFFFFGWAPRRCLHDGGLCGSEMLSIYNMYPSSSSVQQQLQLQARWHAGAESQGRPCR